MYQGSRCFSKSNVVLSTSQNKDALKSSIRMGLFMELLFKKLEYYAILNNSSERYGLYDFY